MNLRNWLKLKWVPSTQPQLQWSTQPQWRNLHDRTQEGKVRRTTTVLYTVLKWTGGKERGSGADHCGVTPMGGVCTQQTCVGTGKKYGESRRKLKVIWVAVPPQVQQQRKNELRWRWKVSKKLVFDDNEDDRDWTIFFFMMTTRRLSPFDFEGGGVMNMSVC